MAQLYDEIGTGYARRRRPDPRIDAAIVRALGDGASALNVGAGAGSYEPTDRRVVAVEPSREMIRQRGAGRAPVVRAVAGALPFEDDAFDAALAVLTVHHWPDRPRGLAELARVAGRVVIVTCDPDFSGFWLVDEYFPEIRENDRRTLPALDELRAVLGEIAVRPLPVPHDCCDGFLGAYWRRPHLYLDDDVRGAISAFAKLASCAAGLDRLRRDLADGRWRRRHGALLERTELDLGYRLIVAGAARVTRG